MYRYQLKESSSGHTTLVCHSDNQAIRLHSAYDPMKEAGRQVSTFNPGRASHIIICGMGLGYHLQAIQQLWPDRKLIIVEHDPEVLDLARTVNPGIMEGATVITGRLDVHNVLEPIEISSFRGARVYRHRPSCQLYPDFYEDMAADIQQFFSSKMSDLLTRFEFEKLWIRNIFSNLNNLDRGYAVHDLFGKFKSIPGIIVSAGPSLRKNIDQLSMLKDRVLIVCVDTALKPMLKKGITPHIVMTLDAQAHSIKHFLGTNTDNAVLLADVVSYPKLVRDYSGPLLFSTTARYYDAPDGSLKREATPVMDWVEQHLPPLGDIQSGGSIATSAFDLVRNLGCDPIILVGQDLAYTGREIHSSGTHHNDEWLPVINRIKNLDTINQSVIRRRKIKFVPSFGNSKPVLTDFVLDLYRQWFSDSAGKVPIEVINATGGGAAIPNTIETSLDKLTSRIPKQKVPPEKILQQFLSHNTTLPTGKIYEEMAGFREQLLHLRSIASAELENENDERNTEELNAILSTDDMNSILKPFLRKALFYFNRHPELPEKKMKDMLCADIIDAADILIPMLSP